MNKRVMQPSIRRDTVWWETGSESFRVTTKKLRALARLATVAILAATPAAATTVGVNFGLIARDGGGGPGGAVYDRVRSPTVSDAGTVVFNTRDQAAGNVDLIVRSDEGVDTIVAREGDAAPGSGGLYTDFSTGLADGDAAYFRAGTTIGGGNSVLVEVESGVETLVVEDGTLVSPSNQAVRSIDNFDVEGGRVLVNLDRAPGFTETVSEVAAGSPPTAVVDESTTGAPIAPGDDFDDMFYDKDGPGFVFRARGGGVDKLIYGDGLGGVSSLLQSGGIYDAVTDPVVDGSTIFVAPERAAGGEDLLALDPLGNQTLLAQSGVALSDGTILDEFGALAVSNGTLFFSARESGSSIESSVLYGFRDGMFSRLLSVGDDLGGGAISDIVLNKFGSRNGRLAVNVFEGDDFDAAVYAGEVQLVPLPAGGPLLLAGVFAAAALRRMRRRA